VKVTGAQAKAAQFILGWRQLELASAARVSITTVSHYENGMRPLSDAAISEMRFVLERAGVEFFAENGGYGARLSKRN
jgi:transcriptional regulator with XRE-family HTH domain